MSTAARIRAHRGPAVLSGGYRPFFLLGALWAALAMIVWIGALAGGAAPPGAFAPLDWHVHALLYGFLPAVAAGFLLTAIPNWTGRLPVTGAPLAALALLWLGGRAAVGASLWIGAGWAAAIDAAFLLAVGLVALREIAAGRNWRNLPVLALVTLLFAGNLVFHWEAARTGYAAGGLGMRIGAAAAVLMILLIGGRVTPSFTRNWLAKRGGEALPAPFGGFDKAALLIAVAALGLWLAAPEAAATGALLLAAGAAHLARLARWRGGRTLAEPLVTILHVGYAFAPLGFLLLGASILAPLEVPRATALHAWLAGAVGVMTLAVMTRASLGHSGRPLAASAPTLAIYAAVVGGALARVAAGFAPGAVWLLHLSAAGWIVAFAGFALAYGPMLTTPRAAKG